MVSSLTSNLIKEEYITCTLKNNYMPYAMSVIVSRAIPDIDGFKPSHRKLLYTMYKMNLLSSGRTKSANVVGQTMKLNPHGDMAIYETMVRLTEGNQALLHPLVDSKGNFGKQYSRDMAFAAARYTEVRLASICSEVFRDIDKNTVDFTDNYDGTIKEPILLPVTFPNILVNPNQGIAVGVASNICSFNLLEVCAATVELLKNADGSIGHILKAPDFSTGGELLYDSESMLNIYENGRGTFKLRAKYKYDKNNNCIDVFEIPYTTTVEAIIDKVVENIKTGKIKEIVDIRDETDLNGLKITIDVKRGVDVNLLMARLFKVTPLTDTFGCNFNILLNGVPKVMGIREIINEWIQFRVTCLKRSFEYEIDKKSEKLHLLCGLEKILFDIDKAIAIIRSTAKDDMVVANIMSEFGIDKMQAEYFVEIKLRNLNKEYVMNKISEIAQLKSDIETLKKLINSDKDIKAIIARQLKEIAKKYGVARKTVIIYNADVTSENQNEYVENYQVKFFRTEHGYLKKIPLAYLKNKNENKVKDGDSIIQNTDASNKSEVLLFGSHGSVYKIKAHEIPDSKINLLGEYIPNLLKFDTDDNIIGMIATENFNGQLLFCFENGKFTKVDLKNYKTKLNRRKLSNAYCTTQHLVKIIHVCGDIDLAAINTSGKVLVFNTSQVPLKISRISQGVNVMTLKKGSYLKDVILAESLELDNLKKYKAKNIPASGSRLQHKDILAKQMTLF